jgi:AraC family transcriptional regulator
MVPFSFWEMMLSSLFSISCALTAVAPEINKASEIKSPDLMFQCFYVCVYFLNLEKILKMTPQSPDFTVISPKLLVAKRIHTSLSDNKTSELWKDFMMNRHLIGNRSSEDLISMSIYRSDYFTNFDPKRTFEKFAAAEVRDHRSVPDGFMAYTIPAGLYAVFHCRGPNTDVSIFRYIFNEWLPASEYDLDQRPHFEILGEKYKNADPDSEEDIYVPIRKK